MTQSRLYYIHDPMCSWCWALRPVWQQVRAQLPTTIDIVYLLGGLAPDTDQPMPDEMQTSIQNAWKKIRHDVPGTEFNFDFWTSCKPRRSTYPSCRAVISAERQEVGAGVRLNFAIQQAYYLSARNPSNNDVLTELATEIGLDPDRFATDLDSAPVATEFERQLDECDRLHAHSYPSICIDTGATIPSIPIDYNNAQTILSNINQVIGVRSEKT